MEDSNSNKKSRTQLNLRMDGRAELLDAAKEAAKAKGQTLTEFVISALEAAVYGTSQESVTQSSQRLDPKLDKLDEIVDKTVEQKLEARLAAIEERLGKLSA